MTKEEIELVAELLAKIGGTWHPERRRSGSRAVGNRHREVARLIVEAVERSKSTNQAAPDNSLQSGSPVDGSQFTFSGHARLQVGAVVLYRVGADKRTVTCRIEKMEGDQVYLVPEHREIGWVSTHTLLPLKRQRAYETQPRPLQTSRMSEGGTVEPFPIAAEGVKFSPQLKIGAAPPDVQYYFSSSGDWIAFRRYRKDRYLFDQKGNWIGWFPWTDNDAVDLNGQYLGTVVDDNRIYRRTFPEPKSREIGLVAPPGHVGYSGYPGHAAPCLPPFGFTDIDLKRIRRGRRFWLKSHGPIETPPSDRSPFYALAAAFGLGRVASWIKRLI
ncbi:hypothetical protein [Microvirga puerhi]|uniref:Uncharacterized protein n=1 Tax=Microvirga puerhi TaxID=2876078 RepID=A0ABS7VS82_9HYPH|nr:hypothetical protein [Microvirga puerhi]MBZ6078409.1 hypothetical protein [Microvirga puerhi]